jgi:5,10-methylenetetrahydromethanopterin reductase
MEFGVAFTSRIGDYDLVALAETLGFDQAWFFDSQMIYSDVYATMALAAHVFDWRPAWPCRPHEWRP